MKNLLSLFIEDLEVTMRITSKDASLLQSYVCLFRTANYSAPESLDYVYADWLEQKDWLKEDDEQKGMWFSAFHKSIRQCDFFVGCNITVKPNSNLNKEEEARYQELQKQYIESREFINDIEWCSDEYYMADARWKIDNKELRSEYSKLGIKRESKNVENIGGHLDSLLWNLIYVDKNGILYKCLEGFFEEIRVGFIKVPS